MTDRALRWVAFAARCYEIHLGVTAWYWRTVDREYQRLCEMGQR